VTKPRILAAVREGAGERAADLIGHLKKGDMAKEAERLLSDTGWLPEPLRVADLDGKQAVAPQADADSGEDAALPDFLAADGDEDDLTEAEDDEHAMIAAE
jgi:ParB family chromosome partitioning protein